MEYHQVYSSDSSSGQVCFTDGIKYKYESTWPVYPTTGTVQMGPGTLFAMETGWDIKITWSGTAASPMTMIAHSQLVDGRDISLVNVIQNDPSGLSPPVTAFVTAAHHVLLQNVTANQTATTQIQGDKEVEYLDIEGGNIGEFLNTTASGAYNFGVNVLDHSLTSNFATLIGTGRYFDGYGVVVPTQFNIGGGPAGGAASYFKCTSCNFITPTAQPVGVILTGSGAVTNSYGLVGGQGVFTFPNTGGPLTWAVPGANYVLGGHFNFGQYSQGYPFTITDITQDATNTYVTTTLTAASLPTLPSSANLFLNLQPVPAMTVTNSTGSPAALEWSLAPPGLPIYSYANRTYTCTSWPPPQYVVWGELVQETINVTVADSTQTTLTAHADSVPTVNSSGAAVTYSPLINLKATGLRTVTPSGVDRRADRRQHHFSGHELVQRWIRSARDRHRLESQ